MSDDDARRLAVMVHPTRDDAHAMAAEFAVGASARGLEVAVPADQRASVIAHLPSEHHHLVHTLDEQPCELVVVFGGDGSILRAAEWALQRDVGLLGVNLGHVGFLAELEPSQIDSLVDHVVDRSFEIEDRVTLDVTVHDAAGALVWQSSAINEVSLEKAARERMLEVMLTIDGRKVSRWGCDGVLVSTPTGSTAYAFSAGGPVMWPDVEAMLVVPLSAHALFARPLVISPASRVDLLVTPDMEGTGVVWCDGRRTVDIPPGSVITVRRGAHPFRIVRLSEQPFADRLVRKFALRVDGWRHPQNPDSGDA